jgi:hypothetical protein
MTLYIDDFGVYSTGGNSQEIALQNGWNLVSLNVSPPDHSLQALLASIAPLVQQVKGTDGVYIPGNPYSTLTSLSDGKAYSIRMSAASTWNLSGSPIPVDTVLPLQNGWNMVAYLPRASMQVATAIFNIRFWLEQVKGTDGVYIPGSPYSTLTTMDPGKGYWIKINGNRHLIYPSGRAGETPTRAAPSDVTRLSGSMVVLARCDAAIAGDLLLARVNGELRGAEPMIAPEGFPAALIQIYSETDGEEICFSLRKADGSELPLLTRLSTLANATLGTDQFIQLMAAASGSEELSPQPTRLIACYPNPFNPSTSIAFNVAEDNSMLSINIYNVKGQKLRQLTHASFSSGTHTVVWNGCDDAGRSVSSGLYLVELKAGSYHKTMKVLLSK